jgi:hypothetical protein
MNPKQTQLALAVLFSINMMNFFDRQILGTVGEQIRKASGALHNFNVYAIGSFIVPLMVRYHEVAIKGVGLRQAMCDAATGAACGPVRNQ